MEQSAPFFRIPEQTDNSFHTPLTFSLLYGCITAGLERGHDCEQADYTGNGNNSYSTFADGVFPAAGRRPNRCACEAVPAPGVRGETHEKRQHETGPCCMLPDNSICANRPSLCWLPTATWVVHRVVPLINTGISPVSVPSASVKFSVADEEVPAKGSQYRIVCPSLSSEKEASPVQTLEAAVCVPTITSAVASERSDMVNCA